jgi:hypothetical protein
MERKSKLKFLITSAVMFILAFGLYAGYSFWETENNNKDIRKISEASAAQTDDVAVFQEGVAVRDYQNVGIFISKFHEDYNQTLGWGGIEKVKWEDQQETASEILNVLAMIHTENQELQADFNTIASYAKKIEDGSKDKKVLQKLHRYFHDLDIEFNGYKKTNDYFNVTDFKRAEKG